MLDVSLTALSMLVQIVTGLVVINPWHTTDPVDIHEELYCLAINSYHEARGEAFDDKLATAQVVMNRATSPKFPDDVCEVITDGPIRESWKTRQHSDLDPLDRVFYPTRYKCQFSWYCDGKPDRPHDLDAYRWAEIIVRHVWDQQDNDITGGATHYHSIDVKPEWAKDKTFLGRVGDHLFYRWEK